MHTHIHTHSNASYKGSKKDYEIDGKDIKIMLIFNKRICNSFPTSNFSGNEDSVQNIHMKKAIES